MFNIYRKIEIIKDLKRLKNFNINGNPLQNSKKDLVDEILELNGKISIVNYKKYDNENKIQIRSATKRKAENNLEPKLDVVTKKIKTNENKTNHQTEIEINKALQPIETIKALKEDTKSSKIVEVGESITMTLLKEIVTNQEELNQAKSGVLKVQKLKGDKMIKKKVKSGLVTKQLKNILSNAKKVDSWD